MERIRLIIFCIFALFLSAFLNAQETKNSFDRAYHTVKSRFDREKQTLIPDYNYHIEATVSYSGAFGLNNLSAKHHSVHDSYRKYVPDFQLRILFINGGNRNQYGLEIGTSYISVPTLNTKATLMKLGVASGRYIELGGHFIYGNSSSLGYLTAWSIVQADHRQIGNSHGLYLANNSSLIYQTKYNSAVGVSFGINIYHLWKWQSKSKELKGTDLGKPGFGIYPTIGITYYLGGL